MKRIFLLMGMLALCACDRPQYDIQLVCDDGAKGQLLVDAKIYKSHADLAITRLSKELREKAQGKLWLADHSWLYNQIPEIDDMIEVSVPANDKHEGYYELAGKIEFNLGRDDLTGGRTFTLWHMSDNNLTADNGDVLSNGTPVIGVGCEPVVDAVKDNPPAGFTSEIKNCLNYINSQLLPGYTESEISYEVYDEKTGRTMYIDKEKFNEAFGETEPHRFYLLNAYYNYPEDALRACDVAARLRSYIAEHIDAEYIPQNPDAISVSRGEELTISCDTDQFVIRGE